MKVHVQSLLIGFVAGAATAVVAPIVVPAVARALRPAAKVALMQGMLGLERLRVTVARAAESVEDLVAEVRAEVEAQLARRKPNARTDIKVSEAPRASASMVS